MKSSWIAVLVAALTVTAVFSLPDPAVATETFHANLDADKEIPACSSKGAGTFKAKVSNDETSIDFELTYDLDGAVRQAHIHFGPFTDRGGIVVWLCGTPTNPGPPGTETCPGPPGTVTGTLDGSNVLTVTDQGIAAGEFAKLLRALRDGLGYANVHSDICPSGEIRGQVRRSIH
jgi:CHRD domain